MGEMISGQAGSVSMYKSLVFIEDTVYLFVIGSGKTAILE